MAHRRTLRRLAALLSVALVPVSPGCASLVEGGLEGLVGDGGPPGADGAPVVGGGYGTSGSATERDGSESEPAGSADDRYQKAPTRDWRHGTGPRPFTPGMSVFEAVSPTGAACRPVPVGLARVYSGPEAPAASPLAHVGPFEVGAAAPDGAMVDVLATSREAVSSRALASGARMAGQGPVCGGRIFLYLRLGHTPDPVLLQR